MTKIPVFLASDDNYAPFVATTIASMCDNTESFIDFYILDGGIIEENKNKIELLKDKFSNFSIEFIKIDLENDFKNFFTSRHISLASYSRFLIPFLKPNLRKVIYADVDIIAAGDIAELYSENLGDYSLAAAWEECFEDYLNTERKRHLKMSNSHKYFNAGVLLIDCEKWRDEKTSEKLIEIALDKGSTLTEHDQDALNLYFEDNYLVLSPKHCFLTEYHDYGVSPEDMVLRHYSRFKPWEVSPDLPDTCNTDHEMFWNYSKMTEFHDNILARVKFNNKIEIIRQNQVYKILLKNLKIGRK